MAVGRSYGTLVLTIAVTAIEVLIIVSMMLHGANNTKLAEAHEGMIANVLPTLAGLIGIVMLAVQVTGSYVLSLCNAGNAVRVNILPRVSHVFIARDSAAAAASWLADRFARKTAPYFSEFNKQ